MWNTKIRKDTYRPARRTPKWSLILYEESIEYGNRCRLFFHALPEVFDGKSGVWPASGEGTASVGRSKKRILPHLHLAVRAHRLHPRGRKIMRLLQRVVMVCAPWDTSLWWFSLSWEGWWQRVIPITTPAESRNILDGLTFLKTVF